MADSTYLPRITLAKSDAADAPRHSAVVRVTHWVTAFNFLVLLGSGITILLAHPRLYWGEVGNINTPSLIDLPLPFVLEIPMRGPGRYIHFLAAWIAVFTGLVYVGSGFLRRHFQNNLLPARNDLSWKSIWRAASNHLHLRPTSAEESRSYNVLQRLSYLTVVFFLFPMMLWTGLAMSPAVTSVVPFIVTIFGGQQSARTIHFFVSCSLVLFVILHVLMVWISGLKIHLRPMITGRSAAGKDRA